MNNVKQSKHIEIKNGSVKLKCTLVHKDVLIIQVTHNVRLKNRIQKLLFKQAGRLRKVGKGLYEVTQSCSFRLSWFTQVVKLIQKDENGELWFNVEDKTKTI